MRHLRIGDVLPGISVDALLHAWLDARSLLVRGDPLRLGPLAALPHDPAQLLPCLDRRCTLSSFAADAQGRLVTRHELERDDALRRFEDGQSIQIAHAETHPPLANAGADLARELGFPASIVTTRIVYSPPGASDAYGWHFDGADVIVAQVVGSKQWQLADNPDVRHPHRAGHPDEPVRGPLDGLPGLSPPEYGPRRFDCSAFDTPRSVRLVAGTAMFVPSGMWHRTGAIGDTVSCSVSFMFQPDSWARLLARAMTSLLTADPRLRRPAVGLGLPGRARSDAHRELAAAVDRLHALVESLDVREVIERATSSRLAHLPASSTQFRLRHTANARIEAAEGGGCSLCCDDIEVELGPTLVDPSRWMLASEGVPFSIAELLHATAEAPLRVDPAHVERVSVLVDALVQLEVLEPARRPPRAARPRRSSGATARSR